MVRPKVKVTRDEEIRIVSFANNLLKIVAGSESPCKLIINSLNMIMAVGLTVSNIGRYRSRSSHNQNSPRL